MKALYKGKKKKLVKTIKAIRKCAPNEKAVNDCEEYLLNNWAGAVRRMQDKECVWMQCRRSCESYVFRPDEFPSDGLERMRCVS